MRLLALLALVAAAPGVLAQAATSDAPAGFRGTLQAHLDAIRNHDLGALTPTITARDSLTLLFPDGTLIRTRRAFLDIHADWFADTTWAMAFEPVAIQEGTDVSVALVRYTLTDDTPRSGRQAYLSLGFRIEDGAWRLFHDQNTALPMEAAE